MKKAVVTTTVKFDNGRKAVFSIQVAFGINDALLQELYRNDVLTQGAKAVSEQRDYSVTPNSILHDFVCTCCNIADLYAKSGATVCRVSSTQDLLTFLEFASLRKQA